MNALLSRFPLKIQIWLLVVVAGLVFGLSAAIQSTSRHEAELGLEAAATQRRLLDLSTQVSVGLLEARRHEKNFILRHDTQSQAEHAQAIAAMRKALDEMNLLLPSSQADKRAKVEAVAKAAGQYVDSFKTLVSQQDKPAAALNEEAAKTEKAMVKIHRESLEPSLNALAAQTTADMTEAANRAAEVTARASKMESTITVGGLILLIVVGWALARSIYKPLNDMTQVMTRLAAGETNIAIPAQDRRDEVGAMARAVQVFSESMREAHDLRERQDEEHRQAAREKAAAVLAMADDFEASVQSKVQEVDKASLGIRSTAQAMAGRSERTGSRSLDVGEAARITNERAAGASEATRQLALAVNEIAQQVSRSTEIARRTVEDVNATATQMNELSGSVQSIGEIVSLINDIAAQTNLLALNATIEAARAGDAGKGFAVVANEVKHLANQTAKATEDISRQVSGIQDSTQRMGASIVGVVDIIRSLDEISSAIASAVQEQEAATRDIADNIDEVAHQANAVSQSVRDLSMASAMTCAGTIRVIWSAKSLAQVVDGLTGETDGFLGRVRTQQPAA